MRNAIAILLLAASCGLCRAQTVVPVDEVRVKAMLEDEVDDTSLEEGQLARVIHDGGAASLRVGTGDGATQAVTDPFSVKAPGERLCDVWELQYAMTGNAHLQEDGSFALINEQASVPADPSNVGTLTLTAPANISRVVYSVATTGAGAARPARVDFLRTSTNAFLWAGDHVTLPPGGSLPDATAVVTVSEVWVDIRSEFRGVADLRTKQVWVRTPDANSDDATAINIEWHDTTERMHRAEHWSAHLAESDAVLDSYALRHSPHFVTVSDARTLTVWGSDAGNDGQLAMRIHRPDPKSAVVRFDRLGTNMYFRLDCGAATTNSPVLEWSQDMSTWTNLATTTNSWPAKAWTVSDGGLRFEAWTIGAVAPTNAAAFFRFRMATAGDDPAGVELPASGSVYLGPPATDGTWRIVRDGDDLAFERRESGAWVSKSVISSTL